MRSESATVLAGKAVEEMGNDRGHIFYRPLSEKALEVGPAMQGYGRGAGLAKNGVTIGLWTDTRRVQAWRKMPKNSNNMVAADEPPMEAIRSATRSSGAKHIEWMTGNRHV